MEPVRPSKHSAPPLVCPSLLAALPLRLRLCALPLFCSAFAFLCVFLSVRQSVCLVRACSLPPPSLAVRFPSCVCVSLRCVMRVEAPPKSAPLCEGRSAASQRAKRGAKGRQETQKKRNETEKEAGAQRKRGEEHTHTHTRARRDGRGTATTRFQLQTT